MDFPTRKDFKGPAWKAVVAAIRDGRVKLDKRYSLEGLSDAVGIRLQCGSKAMLVQFDLAIHRSPYKLVNAGGRGHFNSYFVTSRY